MKKNTKIIAALILGTSLVSAAITGNALADDKERDGHHSGWGGKYHEDCKYDKKGHGYGDHDKHDGKYGGRDGRDMYHKGPEKIGKFIFNKFDTNNDNAIDKTELAKITSTNLEKYDTNSDGTISKEEAGTYANNSWWGGKKRNKMKDKMMTFYDVNSDGDVTKAELEELNNKYFNLFDNNKDGKVEIAEVKSTSKNLKDFMSKKRAEMEEQRNMMKQKLLDEFIEQQSK